MEALGADSRLAALGDVSEMEHERMHGECLVPVNCVIICASACACVYCIPSQRNALLSSDDFQFQLHNFSSRP